MDREFNCPVCHKRLMHIHKEECAGAEGDAWVCLFCKHEFVTEFNGTIYENDEESKHDDER